MVNIDTKLIAMNIKLEKFKEELLLRTATVETEFRSFSVVIPLSSLSSVLRLEWYS